MAEVDSAQSACCGLKSGHINVLLNHQLNHMKILSPLHFACAVIVFITTISPAEDNPKLTALQAVDDARVAAFVAADQAKLGEILSDELRYAHSTGGVDTKKSFIDALATKKAAYNIYKYEERNFTFPAPGVALMTGKLKFQVTNATGVIDGTLGFLAVWREEKGQWRFLAWQSCKLPPPTPVAK
jgi:hypothetical protein